MPVREGAGQGGQSGAGGLIWGGLGALTGGMSNIPKWLWEFHQKNRGQDPYGLYPGGNIYGPPGYRPSPYGETPGETPGLGENPFGQAEYPEFWETFDQGGMFPPWQQFTPPGPTAGMVQPGMEQGWDYGYSLPPGMAPALAGTTPIGGGNMAGMGYGGGFGGGYGGGSGGFGGGGYGGGGGVPPPFPPWSGGSGIPGPYPSSQSVDPFNLQNLWGPMAAGMQEQADVQSGQAAGKFTSGGLGSSSWADALQSNLARQQTSDMNRAFSGLQYQDAQSSWDRMMQQRGFGLQQQQMDLDRYLGQQGIGLQQQQVDLQSLLGRGGLGLDLARAQQGYNQGLMGDIWGMGTTERTMGNQDAAMAYQDWLRRLTWGPDYVRSFLGPGYKPDVVFQPGAEDPSFIDEYGPIIAAIIGAMGNQ